METPTLSSWLLVCATKPEWSHLKKNIPFKRYENTNETILYRGLYCGKEVWLLQTGIGAERAQKGLSIFFDELKAKPKGVIHFGFSGALNGALKTADLIIPSEILSENGEKEALTHPIVSSTKLLLKELELPVTEGIFYTTKRALNTPQVKKETGFKHGAMAVDMESFSVAKICRMKGFPYLAIRAIWDPVEWDLTSLDSLKPTTAKGEINPAFGVKIAFKKPSLIRALPQYQSAASKANKALERFILAALQKENLDNQPKERQTEPGIRAFHEFHEP